jgi:hypothetical protein
LLMSLGVFIKLSSSVTLEDAPSTTTDC